MPSISAFSSGDTVRFTSTFAVGGTNSDPSTSITFRIKNPNGVGASYVYNTDSEVVRSATGVYYVDLILNLPGEHHYRWEGAGNTAPGASEGVIRINRSNVLM